MRKEEIIEILSRWNLWNRDIESGIFRREYTEKLSRFIETDKVLSVIGVRRAGKSYILRQVAKSLLEKYGKENILIVNFEEPAFENTNLSSLQKIYEAYREIIKPKNKPFIFLDEIQAVARWEKFVRSINERKEAFLLISGSSSKLLSKELATILSGRQLYFEIFPLSFKEFLGFNNLEIREIKDLLINSDKIKSFFWEYIKYGGFPEVVINKDEEFKLRTLRNYYDDILLKDVVERFRIKEIEKLKALARFYLTNFSSSITYNRISKFLDLAVETIRRFSIYIETSRCLFFIKRFSFSIKQQEKAPRKVYAIDVGLANAVGFKFSDNIGKIMENVVAIHLLKQQSLNPLLEIYYWKDYYGGEVDFVLKEGLQVKQLIQVCYDISKFSTKERELKALVKASKELKCNNLLIITEDYEGKEEHKGKKINFIPLWKWLLFSQGGK